jgi:hypothetical protein
MKAAIPRRCDILASLEGRACNNRAVIPLQRVRRHPEVLAVFGEPRRMVFSAVRAAILRGSQELAPWMTLH